MLVILEAILIILFWVFVIDNLKGGDALISQRYPAWQDVNVMMLIGFGFLMTFIRSYTWSAIAFTFLTNAIISQYYVLFSAFWKKALNGNFSIVEIDVDIVTLINCSYAVASALVAFGGVIGRVGPKDILIFATFHIIGYTLNEEIVFNKLKMIDAGCSSTIHTFGAYYGLTVCLVLSSKAKPVTNIKTSYFSNIFAFIGTLFLWIYYPSFNYAILAQNEFEQNLIVVNTYFSLIGSLLGTFFISAIGFGRGLEMENILNATLAGGVGIGASVSVIYRPGLAMFIGFMAGCISTICFHKLTSRLLKWINLYDTCGIHNLHGIPGLYGGIWSGIIIGFYNTGYNHDIANRYANPPFSFPDQTIGFVRQGAHQIAGTFCSFGMAIAFGLIGGLVMSCFYTEKP